MTPSSHLWATPFSLPWLCVLTANENLSSHLDLTQACLSVTSAVLCSLSASLLLEALCHHSFNSLIQSPAPAFFHSVRKLAIAYWSESIRCLKNLKRDRISEKQIQGLYSQQDLNRTILRMFSMAKPLQTQFKVSPPLSPFAISKKYHSIFVWCLLSYCTSSYVPKKENTLWIQNVVNESHTFGRWYFT